MWPLHKNALLYIICDLDLVASDLISVLPLPTFLQCLTCDLPFLFEDAMHKGGNASLGPLKS